MRVNDTHSHLPPVQRHTTCEKGAFNVNRCMHATLPLACHKMLEVSLTKKISATSLRSIPRREVESEGGREGVSARGEMPRAHPIVPSR